MALRGRGDIAALSAFSVRVIEALKGIVPCLKIQSACYERFGPDGMRVLQEAMSAAKAAGIVTILDSKRGDIGISAEHYSAAMYKQYGANWSTVNAYLGAETLEPFLSRGGAFALVRTSNPGSDALQTIRTEGGLTIAERVATIIAEAGKASVGSSGYSALGAVVGATKSKEAASLRAIMPQQIFLVPGFGAQGGSVEDVKPCFNQDDCGASRGASRGAIVTASRSVIFAFGANDSDWVSPIQRAAESFASEIRRGISGSSISTTVSR